MLRFLCGAMLERISVVVVTKNEEAHLARCLGALSDFSDVHVVDSVSEDRTRDIAVSFGARVHDFVWNDEYPKKRQWCLDTLVLRDFVLFVDADEVVVPELVAAIAALDGMAAGYFVRGRYVLDDKMLRFGLCNMKLCLLRRDMMVFPVVDDLDIDGMGEIEGHYQPVLVGGGAGAGAGAGGAFPVVDGYVLHHACEDMAAWEARHERYARWQAAVEARGTLPQDVRLSKRVFMALPFKSAAAFLHCYVAKLGFLDGVRGFKFALMRGRYYRMIARAAKTLRTNTDSA